MKESGDTAALEFVVLGTSAAFAAKEEACSSYLLTWRGGHYLIDAGPGSFSVFQNYGLYRDLRGVFLSHLHADHVSDIYSMRYAVYAAQKEGRMRRPIPLYMPRRPGRTFRFIRSVVRGEFRTAAPGGTPALDLDGVRVSFLRTRHPVETYAMRFDRPGSGGGPESLVYTADTEYFPALAEFCAGTRLLVAEATLQNRDRELERLGHMTAKRAGELARACGADTLVLTHIWPEYDRRLSVEEAGRSFGGPVLLAGRGLRLSV